MSPEPTTTTPQPSHPAACRACRGTGWQDAPPIYETIGGQPHPYTQLAPCTHDWWNDDPDA